MEAYKNINVSTLNDTNIDNHSEKHSEQNQDRLSQLPDSILIDILSLIPIETAASTSILSRNWRHLWTEIKLTHLSFLFRHTPMFENLECFITAFDHILSQIIETSNLKSLELDVPFIVETIPAIATELFSGVLAPWIQEICNHDLEVIKLNFEGLDLNIHMHICVLNTRSLVHLQLHATPKMEFEFPNDGTPFIDLPNLKKLDVVLFESQRPLMENLFKSCPLLEDLDMNLHLTNKCYDIDVLAPNLKRLFIKIMGRHYDAKIVIDAPKLEHFDAYGYLVLYEFVNIPSNLLTLATEV